MYIVQYMYCIILRYLYQQVRTTHVHSTYSIHYLYMYLCSTCNNYCIVLRYYIVHTVYTIYTCTYAVIVHIHVIMYMITWDEKKEMKERKKERQGTWGKWNNEKWIASGGIWTHDTQNLNPWHSALRTDALTNWATKAACTCTVVHNYVNVRWYSFSYRYMYI